MHNAGVLLLLFVVLPLWILAGFVDYFCHRKSHIEDNAGPKESALHVLGMAIVAFPLLAGLLLEINALVIAVMFAGLVLHEAVVIWDVRYAAPRRPISTTEQHVHGALEYLPFTAFLLVLTTHWPQFLMLFAAEPGPAQFGFHMKTSPLPAAYLWSIFTAVFLFVVVPYIEELFRGLRAQRQLAARD